MLAFFGRKLIADFNHEALAAACTKGQRPNWQMLVLKGTEAALRLVIASRSPIKTAVKVSLKRSAIYVERHY